MTAFREAMRAAARPALMQEDDSDSAAGTWREQLKQRRRKEMEADLALVSESTPGKLRARPPSPSAGGALAALTRHPCGAAAADEEALSEHMAEARAALAQAMEEAEAEENAQGAPLVTTKFEVCLACHAPSNAHGRCQRRALRQL